MSIPKETSAPVAKSASAKKMLMGDLMQTVGILPILILIVAVFGFIAPNFFTESNLLNITRQASINIVLAAGMTFIILTGGIDLSVGSILGTTAVAAMVVSLISVMRWPPYSLAKLAAAAVAFGAVKNSLTSCRPCARFRSGIAPAIASPPSRHISVRMAFSRMA